MLLSAGGLVDTEAAAGGRAGVGWAGDGNNNSVQSWAQLRDQIRVAEGGQSDKAAVAVCPVLSPSTTVSQGTSSDLGSLFVAYNCGVLQSRHFKTS